VHPVEHDGRQLGSNRSPDRLRWGLRGMPPWAETQGLETPPPAEEPPQRRMRQRGWWVRLPNCPRARARMFDVPWVFLSCIRAPPQQPAPTQARIQLILLSQLQIAPAIALDPVQEGREPRACLDRVRARLRPCTTPLMMSSQPRLFTAPVRERWFDKGAYARSARLKSREESNSTGPPVS
jgi:hypothetical protein